MRYSTVLKTAGAILAAAITSRMIARMVASRRRMPGESVLITGGSRGLGLALALECASRGARVAICGRDADTLARAAERLRERGAEVLPLACDVRNASDIAGAVLQTYDTFGRIDMLINNAGTIAVGPLEAMTRQDYEDAMDTHFWSAYYAVESVLPVFERHGSGRIVNVTSIGGKVSVPHLLPYCVSKFAAVGYSEGLRAELARKNVTVTTICPGLMRTGSPRNAWFKSQHRKEYTWFALSDVLPGSSIAASSAARTIVSAALRGDAEAILSLPAQAIALLHGVAPGLAADLMTLAARLLPGYGGIGQRKMLGAESTSAVTESLLSTLGKKAERDYNQIG